VAVGDDGASAPDAATPSNPAAVAPKAPGAGCELGSTRVGDSSAIHPGDVGESGPPPGESSQAPASAPSTAPAGAGEVPDEDDDGPKVCSMRASVAAAARKRMRSSRSQSWARRSRARHSMRRSLSVTTRPPGTNTLTARRGSPSDTICCLDASAQLPPKGANDKGSLGLMARSAL
jgi:hypothetical protein